MGRMNKADILLDQINALNKELSKHQERCKHPTRHLEYTLKGSSGNYDPSNDCYWTVFHCGLCQKRWTEKGQDDLRGTRK
jgi:hypothetical protein